MCSSAKWISFWILVSNFPDLNVSFSLTVRQVGPGFFKRSFGPDKSMRGQNICRNDALYSFKMKSTSLFSIVPNYSAEYREDLMETFQEICDEDGLLSLDDFLKYDEVAGLIKDGDLEVSEVEMIFKAAPKADGKKIDGEGFIKVNWQIDELFEFEEEEVPVPEDVEEQVKSLEQDISVPVDEEEAIEYDEAVLKKEFKDIADKNGCISFAEFVAWQEIDDMLKEEDIMIGELEDMWKETPKAAADGQKIEFDGFFSLMKQIEDLFYYEDESGVLSKEEEEEEQVTEATATPKASSSNSAPNAMPDLVASSKAAKLAALKAGTLAVDGAAVKEELLDLIDPMVEDVGIDASSKEKNTIVQLAKQLLNSEDNLVKKLSRDDMLDALTGNWQLLFTSSSTVGFNQGLTGLAKTLPGASFNEVFMTLKKDGFLQELLYTENLNLGEEKDLDVTVDGDWDVLSKKSILTGQQVLSLVAYPKDIRYSFVKMKADKWKALRPANTLDLVYLDENIRIMQVQSVPETIFVFQKI